MLAKTPIDILKIHLFNKPGFSHIFLFDREC